MTDQIVEVVPPRLMTKAEQNLAQTIYQAVQWHSTKSARAQQSAEFRAGIDAELLDQQRACPLRSQVFDRGNKS